MVEFHVVGWCGISK